MDFIFLFKNYKSNLLLCFSLRGHATFKMAKKKLFQRFFFSRKKRDILMKLYIVILLKKKYTKKFFWDFFRPTGVGYRGFPKTLKIRGVHHNSSPKRLKEKKNGVLFSIESPLEWTRIIKFGWKKKMAAFFRKNRFFGPPNGL